MNKYCAVLVAGLAAASFAVAQTSPPSLTPPQREQAIKADTAGNPNNDAGVAATAKQQAANVKASQQTKKLTTAEKNAAFKEANKQMINPNNPSGGVAETNAQQKANTAISKGQSKQTTNLNTPAAEKAIEKAATK